jgi:signal transduction histidine kinase
MFRFNSIRFRFFGALVVWLVLAIGTVWLVTTHLFEKNTEESFREELGVHIQELERLTEYHADGTPYLQRPLSDPRYEVPLSGFYWQVTVPGGTTIRSPSLIRGGFDDRIAARAKVQQVVERGPTGPALTYGFSRQSGSGNQVRFLIATDTRMIEELVQEFRASLVFWLAILAAGLFAGGLVVAVFGARPLDRLARATASLRTGQVETLEGRYPSEIAPLVAELNAYIIQKQADVTRAREQAANLAHSLRTPLAVMTDEAERLAAKPSTAKAAALLLQQSELMARKIKFELARARSTGDVRNISARTTLPDAIVPVIEAIGRLHSDKQFSFENRGGAERTIPVDPVDFVELLSNILDNAGKWARSRVLVSCRAGVGATMLTIADDGPGMPPEKIAEACQVGVRFDPAMEGAGLGLAIVKDIAEMNRIQLDFFSGKAPLHGLTIRLAIPLVVEI